MSISGISSSASVFEIANNFLINTSESNTTNVQAISSGIDTVSISDEARSLFAQMQSGETLSSEEQSKNMRNAEGMLSENNEESTSELVDYVEGTGASSSEQQKESDGNSFGEMGGGGGSGGGGGGSAEEDDSESEESLRSEISALTAQIAQAQVTAKQSGNSSQVDALKAELAVLESELYGLV